MRGQLALTDTALRNLKPKAKPYKRFDSHGLYLLVKPSGTKTWRYKYRLGGKEKTLTIGRYPLLSLKDAREAHTAARKLLADGHDPSLEKQLSKQRRADDRDQTFRVYSLKYREKKMVEWSPATLSKFDSYMVRINGAFGEIPIKSITPKMVVDFLYSIQNEGFYETTKRSRMYMQKIFGFALAEGAIEIIPTYGLSDLLKAPKAKPTSAILSSNELGKLLVKLDEYGGSKTTITAIKVVMLTALRPGEVRNATWSEFDSDEGTLKIASERMKTRKQHTAYLSKQACELIESMRPLTGDSEYIFKGQSRHNKPLSENTFNQALRRMGYGPEIVTAHGFRSSFSTIVNETHLFHPDVVERTLAHAGVGVRAIYNRADHAKDRRHLAEWWSNMLAEAKQTAAANLQKSID